MIIRKPYAFLIKNFRKIHIFLLILCFFVAYKLYDVSRFVGDFTSLGIYDLYSDPITKHISIFLTISVILLIIGSLALLFLLRHKKKPWKIYLIPVFEYIALLFVLNMIKNFFKVYTIGVAATDLVMSKDLLMVFSIIQIVPIGIFAMRILGLDIKKFNFNIDEEFLELSEEDREEIEIGLDIDKNTFIRGYKRLFRNLKYVYQEHKLIFKIIFCVLTIVIVFTGYKTFFITHKSYKEGDFYSANGFTFRVNNVYYSDKDYTGKKIENKSNFVVVDITIVNNAEPRTIYLENFHIKNGTSDSVTTNKTYATEFQDLGNAYESTRKLKRDEKLDCIMIYKVDKELNRNGFVLFYQEKSGYLRKIKLNVKDLSKMEDTVELKIGDELNLGFKNNSDVIIFENGMFTHEIEYTTRNVTSDGTTLEELELTVEGDYTILEIDFSSETWDAKNMIDFLRKYGKLIYKDSEGEKVEIDIENPINKTYYGKSIFLKVPVELESSEDVSLDLVIRNKHYIYKII